MYQVLAGSVAAGSGSAATRRAAAGTRRRLRADVALRVARTR